MTVTELNCSEETLMIEVAAKSQVGDRHINEDKMVVDECPCVNDGICVNDDSCVNDGLCINDGSCVNDGLYKISLNKPRVFIVCDGMGGEDYGEMSAHIAIKSFESNKNILRSEKEQKIQELIIKTNQKVCKMLEENSAKGGTTFSIAIIDKNRKLTTYNVGDSLIFVYRDGILTQISEEQNLAGIKYKKGLISKEQYQVSRDKYVLLARLGDNTECSMKHIFKNEFSLDSGDIVIVCSDGITDALTTEDMVCILRKGGKIADMRDNILEQADQRDNSDNATLIMIKI